MKVALIEAQDFAFGTSSRSSKLIHGGIRYLENLEFGLVFEALNERSRLFEMAPHLVHPLRFVLPIYQGARVGMFKLGLGMWLYDALALFEAPQMHERLGAHEMHERLPMLDETNLMGGYAYSDAYMDDDRLVIETLRSAASWGAVVANYCRATGAKMTDGKVSEVILRDSLQGKEFTIKGRHFVSTVGPWTDMVAPTLLGEWKKKLRPSKGVHLTFRRERLQLQDAVVMISDDEKRIVFAIPRHEMIIIGTTDTDFQGDPANVHTTRADVDYILRIASDYFPHAQLKEEDIVASYAGVRPLVHDGSESESKTSREHLIFTDPRNVTFVTGGKYTTYRSMAEETVKLVLEQFDMETRLRWSKSRSTEPLNALVNKETFPHAQRMASIWAKEFGLDVDTVHMLTERHGQEAFSILKKWAPVVPADHALWFLEALHAIHETMCLNLCDFYLRRFPLFLSYPDHGDSLLDGLSRLFQRELEWTESERQAAIDAVRQHAKFELGWRGSARQ
jgi:glycerol-3-phosphate dehydrogenase